MAPGTEEDGQPQHAECRGRHPGGCERPGLRPLPLGVQPSHLRSAGQQRQGEGEQKLPQLPGGPAAQQHERRRGEGEQRIGCEPGAERLVHAAAAEGRSQGQRDAADHGPFHLRVHLPEETHRDVRLRAWCREVLPLVGVVAPHVPPFSQSQFISCCLAGTVGLTCRAAGGACLSRPCARQCGHCACAHRRTPHRSLADSTAEKADGGSPSTPLCVITNRPPPSTANGVTSASLLSTPGTDSSAEARERRRSYLTPVRDEEAESLRKARSRQARQTRRSTQGVTLTDLQEAERTFSRSRAERQAQDQPGQKPGTEGLEGPTKDTGEGRQPWGRGQEEEPASRRLRGAAQPEKPTTAVSPSTSRPTLYTSSHLLRTSGPAGPDAESSEAKDMDRDESEEAGADDPGAGGLTVRERRRPRERRRGTGISFWTKDEEEADGSEEGKEARHERLSRLESGGSNPTASDSYGDRTSARARREAREARLASLASLADEDGSRDYKKLYEGALTENQKLKTKLQEAQLELADVKSRLEKVAQQKQEKTPDRSSLLEVEKRERRALERKMSEMEEEMKNLHQLKQIQTLKQMNAQLQAENRALARVVARLSASVESAQSQEL
ncbi:protein phosphatase 1 regulatory subunit 12B isoform X11 [Pipistrellus kuhlii]|uniref:protein phosphatase 1 regulatory subunit 12B isoform X11 n=1 Tax=Pipistrellus kuhlii TaxID=59472 RepID=UPI001E270634|nr:protein phosphatase 1 regulatory subunit 12B isoform X11 [Pipistrellus kuhlii]